MQNNQNNKNKRNNQNNDYPNGCFASIFLNQHFGKPFAVKKIDRLPSFLEKRRVIKHVEPSQCVVHVGIIMSLQGTRLGVVFPVLRYATFILLPLCPQEVRNVIGTEVGEDMTTFSAASAFLKPMFQKISSIICRSPLLSIKTFFVRCDDNSLV